MVGSFFFIVVSSRAGRAVPWHRLTEGSVVLPRCFFFCLLLFVLSCWADGVSALAEQALQDRTNTRRLFFSVSRHSDCDAEESAGREESAGVHCYIYARYLVGIK